MSDENEVRQEVRTGSSGNRIAKEVAVRYFEDWAHAMDIDIETESMDKDDLKGFEKQKRRIINAIMDGSLTFNEDGEAVYSCRQRDDIDPLVFHERTGASLMAMDRQKQGHDFTRMYAVLADITRTHTKTFASMKGIDIKVCEALFALLMD